MKTITKTVYDFNELGDKSKERAREWYRSGALDFEWWDSTHYDAATIGLKITGFGLYRSRYATGEFNCIGQGEQCANLILANHGKDCETFKTAQDYLAKLAALNKEIESVDGDDETSADYETWQDKRGLLEDDFLAAILKDYSVLLLKECEYLLSDEAVDESILANDYTFDETGKREGYLTH